MNDMLNKTITTMDNISEVNRTKSRKKFKRIFSGKSAPQSPNYSVLSIKPEFKKTSFFESTQQYFGNEKAKSTRHST